MDNKELLDLVSKIRLGLESFRDQLDSRGIYQNFYKFPEGCCGDTTMIVNHILVNKGFSNVQQVTAQKDTTHESHAWTLLNDICIDLTADQFDGFEGNSILFTTEDNYPLNKIYPRQSTSLWPLDREYLFNILNYLENHNHI
ncbi:hypothetical protein [Acinetobacter sp. Marseille-Q1618]|uniref:hypothetical protein n=1 Tax=Acinetobacter sp. Marseille-Q1618 TaxID=2697502 RepID=UPI00156EFEB7|nr:hypothetical protein [Acinetobacter sp. Marseille-Q1618]